MSNIIQFWKKAGKQPELSNAEFQQLLSPHINPLYNLAYHWCGGNKHDTEDLMQNLLYKLYLKRDTLTTVDQLRPWLVRVLYRLFIDQYRQNTRTMLYSVELSAIDSLEDTPGAQIHPSEQPENILDSNLFLERLSTAISRLPEQQRVLVVMHDIENYQMGEISEILEIPVGTVKSRLHRARERLRNILSASGTFSDVDPC